MRHINYHHLQYFAAVVQEGGLTRAAKRLGVSHPTVSDQVRKLEEQLELKLFARRGRGLRLTDAGEMVYSYAEQIFGVGAALLDAVEGRHSGRTVALRVGVDSVLAKLAVRRILKPVLDRYGTALRLRCVEDESEPLIARIRTNRLDVVLSDAPAPPSAASGVRSWPLETAKLSLFATPSLRAQLRGEFPKCLDGAPFLLPMPATRKRRELERWMREQGITPVVIGEMEDSGLIKAFGQAGRGVFAMPSSVAEEICEQYGVELLGHARAVDARVFAITLEDGIPPAVETLLEAHAGARSDGPAQDA